MQVGTTKDQGLYNKPLAAVRPGALTAGTVPQYNTNVVCNIVKQHEHSDCNTKGSAEKNFLG